MTTETQGKTPNDSTNQPQNDTELLRIMTGYNQHASCFQLQPARARTKRKRRKLASHSTHSCVPDDMSQTAERALEKTLL